MYPSCWMQQGPRQDAGLVSDVDPGVKLMAKIYNYVKKYHPDVQLMASGIRTKKQALALAGLDYLVASPQARKTLLGPGFLQHLLWMPVLFSILRIPYIS